MMCACAEIAEVGGDWEGVLDVVAIAFYAGFLCGVLIEFSEQLACFVLGVAEILLVLQVCVSLPILPRSMRRLLKNASGDVPTSLSSIVATKIKPGKR